MDGFDTSTMTYMAPAIPVSTLPASDAFTKPGPVPVDMQDMFSNFDMTTYAGSEDYAFHGMQSISPNLKRMQSGFDDAAYSDIVSHFDTQTNHENQEPETTIERDHQLLSFSVPSFDRALLDYTFHQTTISLTAKLHGMFFLAESPWGASSDAVPPPTDLTCYRRNLFQIAGSVTIPRSLRYILTEHGEQVPIVSHELTVSANESIENNTVKIISVPWKTPANPTGQPASEEKAPEKEPPAIALGPTSPQDLDTEFLQVPFTWKRLQFRIATANNGRRKELQQRFVIRLKVMATLANGTRCPICEVRSGAIIVRGRSPRNFQSRKDTPLNGTATHARKSGPSIAQPQRTMSGDSAGKANAANGPSIALAGNVKVEVPHPPPSVQSFFEPNGVAGGQDFYEGIVSGNLHHGAMTAVPQEPFSFERHLGYAGSSPDFGRIVKPLPSSSAPINLSLVDEDLPRKPDFPLQRDSITPSKRPLMPPPRPPSFSLNTVSTPDESADLLYEYFPLALEEWMPPVDAVYRPHVVHHIKVSPDPRDPNGGTTRGRSKRYFSEVAG
ncbi:hypothetical protein ANO11243_021220 [Dothideomycetidae sp. 11243]|nr:hypothetical protein ANO11243_021220 [fungal sp. No.11243]